jgi:hypothetical protein
MIDVKRRVRRKKLYCPHRALHKSDSLCVRHVFTPASVL